MHNKTRINVKYSLKSSGSQTNHKSSLCPGGESRSLCPDLGHFHRCVVMCVIPNPSLTSDNHKCNARNVALTRYHEPPWVCLVEISHKLNDMRRPYLDVSDFIHQCTDKLQFRWRTVFHNLKYLRYVEQYCNRGPMSMVTQSMVTIR